MIEILQKYKKRTGFSWRKIGRLADLDHTTIGDWNSGDAIPTYDSAVKFEQATGVPAKELISEAVQAKQLKNAEASQ